MSHFNPPTSTLKSINTYLSGIVNQLKTHFFDIICTAHKSLLVSCALWAVKQHYSIPTLQKLALTADNILAIFDSYGPNPDHNDLLFAAQVSAGTNCLMQLAKITSPDKLSLYDYCKVSMHHFVEFLLNAFSFWLPGHKTSSLKVTAQSFAREVCQTCTPVSTSTFHCETLDSLSSPSYVYGLMEPCQLIPGLLLNYVISSQVNCWVCWRSYHSY